ncbi:hypothetical protein QHL1GM_11170 [Halomonas sp. QHL1]|nr:hypothetical protein QHL1GM_11170 [Halomonas sp. QHL1]
MSFYYLKTSSVDSANFIASATVERLWALKTPPSIAVCDLFAHFLLSRASEAHSALQHRYFIARE